jgi:hypothetical protein
MFGTLDAYRDTIASMQRRINCRYEHLPQGDEAQFLLVGIPGLVRVHDFGATPIRGGYAKGQYLYLVHTNKLYRMNAAEQIQEVATLNSESGLVNIEANINQLAIADGSKLSVYGTTAGGFQTAPIPFSNPGSLAYIDGQLLCSRNGENIFNLGAIENALTWDGADFASAESSPDAIVRIIADRGNAVIFNETTTEFWSNNGSADFPFQRIAGSTINVGLAAKWSVTPFGTDENSSIAFLARARLGKPYVAILTGGQVQEISTNAIAERITAPDFGPTADAVGFSYLEGGHPIYVINFPTANVSLAYDGATGVWHEQQDSNGNRYRGNLGFQFNGKDYVTDWEDGRLYRLDSNTYTDDGETQVMDIVTNHVRRNGYWVGVDNIEVLCQRNVATAFGQGQDPIIMLRISRDGGHTWGPVVPLRMGKLGETLLRCYANRLGAGRDLVFWLRITDPVRRALVGAYISFRGGDGSSTTQESGS